MPPNIQPLLLANILVGAAMLLLGRRLFWVFVAGTGFTVGALLAVEWFGQRADWIAIAAAIAAGMLGAVIAIFAQKLAVGFAGLLAGAYLGRALGMATDLAVPGWIPVIVGGILGALILAALFNWALIALSSLLGAAVIAQAVPLDRPWPTVVFVLLLGAGLAIQSRQHVLRKIEPSPKAA